MPVVILLNVISLPFCDCLWGIRIVFPGYNLELAMQEFLPSTDIYNIPPQTPPTPEDPHRESVLITLIGSTIAMDLIIKHLHKLGFAETNAWSKEQTEPKSEQPMRVLKKWVRV